MSSEFIDEVRRVFYLEDRIKEPAQILGGEGNLNRAVVKIAFGKRARIRRGEPAIETVTEVQSEHNSGNYYKNMELGISMMIATVENSRNR